MEKVGWLVFVVLCAGCSTGTTPGSRGPADDGTHGTAPWPADWCKAGMKDYFAPAYGEAGYGRGGDPDEVERASAKYCSDVSTYVQDVCVQAALANAKKNHYGLSKSLFADCQSVKDSAGALCSRKSYETRNDLDKECAGVKTRAQDGCEAAAYQANQRFDNACLKLGESGIECAKASYEAWGQLASECLLIKNDIQDECVGLSIKSTEDSSISGICATLKTSDYNSDWKERLLKSLPYFDPLKKKKK